MEKIKSELVEKTEKLVESSSVMEKETLIAQINKLLNISIENELMFSEIIRDGAVYKNSDGEDTVSNTAIALHSKRKDSISDLVKIKQLLDGLPTGEEKNINVYNIINQLQREFCKSGGASMALDPRDGMDAR